MEPICTIWPYKWLDTEGQLLPHCTCASSPASLELGGIDQGRSLAHSRNREDEQLFISSQKGRSMKRQGWIGVLDMSAYYLQSAFATREAFLQINLGSWTLTTLINTVS